EEPHALQHEEHGASSVNGFHLTNLFRIGTDLENDNQPAVIEHRLPQQEVEKRRNLQTVSFADERAKVRTFAHMNRVIYPPTDYTQYLDKLGEVYVRHRADRRRPGGVRDDGDRRVARGHEHQGGAGQLGKQVQPDERRADGAGGRRRGLPVRNGGRHRLPRQPHRCRLQQHVSLVRGLVQRPAAGADDAKLAGRHAAGADERDVGAGETAGSEGKSRLLRGDAGVVGQAGRGLDAAGLGEHLFRDQRRLLAADKAARGNDFAHGRRQDALHHRSLAGRRSGVSGLDVVGKDQSHDGSYVHLRRCGRAVRGAVRAPRRVFGGRRRDRVARADHRVGRVRTDGLPGGESLQVRHDGTARRESLFARQGLLRTLGRVERRAIAGAGVRGAGPELRDVPLLHALVDRRHALLGPGCHPERRRDHGRRLRERGACAGQRSAAALRALPDRAVR
ncbi:unnamed protein product, partial [Amoebophrya sp. A120]